MQGYADWTTWNCALWLNNDRSLYDLARRYRSNGYAGLVEELEQLGRSKTPDGTPWAEANYEEMNEVLEELAGD